MRKGPLHNDILYVFKGTVILNLDPSVHVIIFINRKPFDCLIVLMKQS